MWRVNVLPNVISGQFVEHCKLSFLQGIQPAASLHFLRDIQAHSLLTLWKGSRLVSAMRGFEYIQWVSYIQLTKPPVHILSGAQQNVKLFTSDYELRHGRRGVRKIYFLCFTAYTVPTLRPAGRVRLRK
jgi:hypothetical protein